MDPPRAEGNFCDNSNHHVKSHFVEWYNRHMGYFDDSDCMANSFSMSGQTFKRNTKLFLNFLDRTVLSNWLLLFHVGLNIPTEISGSFWRGI